MHLCRPFVHGEGGQAFVLLAQKEPAISAQASACVHEVSGVKLCGSSPGVALRGLV